MSDIKCRLITPEKIQTILFLEGPEGEKAKLVIKEWDPGTSQDDIQKVIDYNAVKAEHAGKIFNDEKTGKEFKATIGGLAYGRNFWPTKSGFPEPGDMYFRKLDEWHVKHIGWTNSDYKHLYVVCPDGWTWDIDSRASNCTMKNETTHRCWIRHGEAPNITVDKNGHTCNAGAGSIGTPNWHGFLTNGILSTNRNPKPL